MFGIRMVPLYVPLERRMQTLMVAVFLSLQFFCIALSIVMICIPICWPFIIPYIFWIAYIDKASTNGRGRSRLWIRRLQIFKYFKDYFPVRLEKATILKFGAETSIELDPAKNYIFAFHPHGIIGLSAVINFGTEANNFHLLFPGIKLKVCTLGINFKIPFYREYLLGLGFADVGPKSISNILSQGPGHSCLIVVGGAEESLYARPNSNTLVLKDRTGFVKQAILNNANLVPVFSFGENDIYDQVENPPDSKVRKFQEYLKKKVGFTLPLVIGRGMFNYSFGFLPQRREIFTVVGEPIDVPYIPNPTARDIEQVHAKYMAALENLFNKYKSRFPNEVAPIEFVSAKQASSSEK